MSIRPSLLLLGSVALAADSPADRLPDPRPEPCPIFDPDLADHDMATPTGLSYEEVRMALNGVINTALYCGQPEGRTSLGLTYELTVGCDGVVAAVECSDSDDAPGDYVQCVADVLKKADFPPHEMSDGMPVTYPVNVSW